MQEVTTKEEARTFLGRACTFHGPCDTGYKGVLVAWEVNHNRWLTYSERLAQEGHGHAGDARREDVGTHTGNKYGHWWRDPEDIILCQTMRICGNTLILEDN